ncbi:short-chain dehydrogenase [Haloferax sp. Atlit-47N]|uniref:Oxidoreductase n=1 Tax=Haloferax sp. Atlit-48N TaxID=2077198 RepID=A0ACD5I207_9EURY|nr:MULTISPECIES: oxidoreductase [unclassified Haloferax]RDZ30903.1 short-chain dehydrogenase [Haloferax sp. Atlit-48N]RDZ38465.1 short-chain dehydrogenase [Haloferax sp. Atlit-47N]
MSEPNGSIESVDDGPDRSRDIGTVVVTGANSGLGFEVTKALAEQGAHVVMACRSIDRGEDAKREIEAEVPEASLTVHELDLADLDSVAAFAEWFESMYDELHVLCNNAGIMAIPRKETTDGFEYQFGVNHLGHFALTAHLLPLLEQTPGTTRVVTQSSVAHRNSEIDFEDLQGEQSYSAWDAYGQSKLANLLFAYELDRRLRAADASVISVACHPGWAATNLQRRGPEQSGSQLRLWMMKLANAVIAQSAERGAEPMLYAATDPGIEGGEYVGPDGFRNMRGSPEIQESSDRSYDVDTAKRLWEVSEDLTGVSFDLPLVEANWQ